MHSIIITRAWSVVSYSHKTTGYCEVVLDGTHIISDHRFQGLHYAYQLSHKDNRDYRESNNTATVRGVGQPSTLRLAHNEALLAVMSLDIKGGW